MRLGIQDVEGALVWRDVILTMIVIVHVAKQKVVRSACPLRSDMHARPSMKQIPSRKREHNRQVLRST